MDYVLLLLATSLLLNVFHKFAAELNVIPVDTEVKVNDSTYMNCSTSLEAEKVQWRHGNYYVYTGRDILQPYNVRFSVEIDALTGTSRLVIRSVQPSDAGQYECSEDEGFGERRSAQLIVVDKDPVCKSSVCSTGVIGPNTCGIEPEEIKLSCRITYHGKNVPILQWKARGDNQPIKEGLSNFSISKHDVTYTLTMKSTLDLNDSSFICQTTRASERNYSCSSDIIKILYVFSSKITINTTMNDEVNCFANTSQSCSYKWKWLSDYDWITLSDGQTLKTNKVGWHRCEATCSLGYKPCTVEVMYAEVYSAEVYSAEVYSYPVLATSGQNLLPLLIPFAMPVVAIIGFVMYCWRKKRKPMLNTIELELRERNRQEEQQRLIDPLTKLREKPELVKRIDVECSVWGLALLNGELFVASIFAAIISVYDPVSFERLRTIPLEDFTEPRDIASCQEENCLFVIIYSSPSLFCIDRNGKMLKTWPVPYQPHNLSITPSGNILLTCNAKILIYTTDGHIMQDISYDANALDWSWETILSKSGYFFICQGWLDSEHHRVVKLNSEGAIVKSSESEIPDLSSHLSNPVYMAMDRDELIFVADSGNNRVVLLNRELVFVKELISKNDGINDPTCVLLDEASELLYVGTDYKQLLCFKVFK